MERYKQNLHIDGNRVISYTTHVATIDRMNGKLYRHGYWSVTTSKHINYVAREYGLTIEDKPQDELHDSYNGHVVAKDDTSDLKSIAMVMALGSIFSNNQKESNDWKTRMLKAGLDGRGLIMPDDWDSLSEDEKTKRLDGVVETLKA